MRMLLMCAVQHKARQDNTLTNLGDHESGDSLTESPGKEIEVIWARDAKKQHDTFICIGWREMV